MKQLFREKWPFLVKFRLTWALVLLALVLVFLYLKIVPGGEVSYMRFWPAKFSLGKGFINNFTPIDRVDDSSNEVVKIIGDPVYFSVFTPRTFDKARLTIIYRDNLKINTPLIEAGVLADKTIWRYDLQPISNKSLDYLGILWEKKEENGQIFIQKEEHYSSISELENDLRSGGLKACSLPLERCLAVYNYTPDYNYQIANYQRSLPINITKSLRGPHQFYLYSSGDPLYLKLTFDYLRQSAKPSPIEVILSSQSEIIKSINISDDGTVSGDSGKEIIIEEKNLPAGVYKVDIKSSDDVLIKNIYSSLGKLTFVNKVWLYGNTGEQLDLYTDSNHLQVKLLNPASRQKIIFDEQEFNLTEAYLQTELFSPSPKAIKKISLEKDDIILENNRGLSLTADSLFNPNFMKVDRLFSVDSAPPYIIAKYQKPFEEEGLKTATAEFNLKGVYREKGKYSFMISIPGLRAEDNIADNVEIYEVKIDFSGRTIWQKLSDYWR